MRLCRLCVLYFVFMGILLVYDQDKVQAQGCGGMISPPPRSFVNANSVTPIRWTDGCFSTPEQNGVARFFFNIYDPLGTRLVSVTGDGVTRCGDANQFFCASLATMHSGAITLRTNDILGNVTLWSVPQYNDESFGQWIYGGYFENIIPQVLTVRYRRTPLTNKHRLYWNRVSGATNYVINVYNSNGVKIAAQDTPNRFAEFDPTSVWENHDPFSVCIIGYKTYNAIRQYGKKWACNTVFYPKDVATGPDSDDYPDQILNMTVPGNEMPPTIADDLFAQTGNTNGLQMQTSSNGGIVIPGEIIPYINDSSGMNVPPLNP